MTTRVQARDLAFLAEETPSTPRHNATVEVFEPGESGFDYERLLELIEDRISFVPRYRQRLQAVPGRLANPVWIDDPDFDLGYHVRRSALPRPGTPEQLRELVARIVSRPLDRSKPLWEVYFVEGLADGRVALLYKAHQALVDGVHTVDLARCSSTPRPSPSCWAATTGTPGSGPPHRACWPGRCATTSPARTVLGQTLRSASASATRTAEAAGERAGRVLGALTGRGNERETPISGRLSQQRRVVSVHTALADHQLIRDGHGGTVNDVVLATITGRPAGLADDPLGVDGRDCGASARWCRSR